jgi:hypothetical protein
MEGAVSQEGRFVQDHLPEILWKRGVVEISAILIRSKGTYR